jgi:hypothetical protein
MILMKGAFVPPRRLDCFVRTNRTTLDAVFSNGRAQRFSTTFAGWPQKAQPLMPKRVWIPFLKPGSRFVHFQRVLSENLVSSLCNE